MKAIFDFESGGPNELSFVVGEVLTVVEKVCTNCSVTRDVKFVFFS